MKELQKKLLAIQSELRCPKLQFNKFGNYSYRNAEDILEAVKPLCVKHGCLLTITDRVETVGKYNYVVATAAVSDTDELIIVQGWAREAEQQKGMNDSQLTGSTSSYARKYAMNGLFCIDDVKDADNDNGQHDKVNPLYTEYKTKIEKSVVLEELESYIPELQQLKGTISQKEYDSLGQLYKIKKNSFNGENKNGIKEFIKEINCSEPDEDKK
jgi:hypothetical protein